MSPTKHEKLLAYINENPVCTLGTVDASGKPHGAAMYAYAKTANEVYLVTKRETRKFKELTKNAHVCLTFVNINDDSTLQAEGKATVIEDARTIEMVMEKMTHIYTRGADWLPPIAKLRAGPYEVIMVKLTSARLAEFKTAKPGDKHLFVEL